jgi:LysR family glycine cleavage system transcriptional activator
MPGTPPLAMLRTFEAAARHLSFTLAARELHVTQAAVSQQIRQLEAILEVRLFKRMNRALLLTDAGQEYAVPVRQALLEINEATRRLSGRHQKTGILTISVLPSIAARWLVPRIGRFRQRHPEIDLRLHTSFIPVDFNRDGVDAAIRLGYWGSPAMHRYLYGEMLMREYIFPVCAPTLLNGTPPLRRPEDLRFHTLLQDEYIDWDDWFEKAGVTGDFDTHTGPAFFDSAMSLQAAVDGVGVALGRTPLIARDLMVGRLVAPFPLRVVHRHAYRFVCPQGDEDNPKVRAFRDWLLEEIADWKREISGHPMLSLDDIQENEDA